MMIRPKRSSYLIAAGIAATVTFLTTGCAGKKTQEDADRIARESAIPLVGTYKVNRFTLDNGLRLLVVEDHSSPTFAYHTWFKVGSRDELPGRTGLAHLFEHMMFKETKSLKDGEFDRILEGAGAEGENAFTSRDYTAYVQELPKDKLELIAKLEADRMVNLVVNEKAFKTETEVVQNERRFRNENSPDGMMYQELFELAFTKHPYHWPVIGYQKDLDSMSGKDAEEFYRSYYSPNHATIIVVGDVTPTQVLETVKKHYGALEAQAAPARTIEPEPLQDGARRKTLKFNMKNEKLIIGYHIPAITHEDIPALNMMQTVLSGGKSSRFQRALVETGIATSVEAYGLDDKDPSLFVIGVDLQKGRKAAQAETIILREIERLAKTPVSETELERARNSSSFEFYSGLNTHSQIARFLGAYEALAGNFELGINIQKQSMTVPASVISQITRKYLSPNNRSVITGVPK